MLKSVPFLTSNVYFDDFGSGKVILLLHGYLETMEIWGDFAQKLAKSFRIITVDIPGHGKSGKVKDVHDFETMAEAVNTVLAFLHIEKCFVVGHSMGGYVALAFMAKYRFKLSGLCLFHSTPFADTDEKRANRDREISLIKEGKREILFNTNIPKSFATDNHIKMSAEISRACEIAAKNEDDGIIALLEGMKIRTDKQDLLKETGLPVLFILGKKDNYIPYDLLSTVAQRTSTGEILTLENSGHMGFFEEPDVCLSTLTSFVNQY